MDPLGLGRDIFRLIGLFYWGLAIVLLCVALVKPRRPVFKVMWVAVIVTAFLSPHYFLSNKYQRMNVAFQDACGQVRSTIQQVESESGMFADYELLWLGLKSAPYETGSIKYMLERKLAFLELSYDPSFWRGLIRQEAGPPNFQFNATRNSDSQVVQGGTYVRLSLENAGHNSCKGFDRWASEFPGQRWPWMQQFGLRREQCIGIELVNNLQSRYGVHMKKSDLMEINKGGFVELHEYRVHDHLNKVDVGDASLVIGTAYSHRDILCDGKSVAEQVRSAIKPKPDPRYSNVDEIVVEAMPFPVAIDLSLEELKLRGLNFNDRDISQDRSVWTRGIYERHVGPDGSTTITLVGYELNSLWNDRVHHIRLSSHLLPKRQGPSVVGAKDGVVSALFRGGDDRFGYGILLEYSRSGEPLREQLIDPYQMKALFAQ